MSPRYVKRMKQAMKDINLVLVWNNFEDVDSLPSILP
ncbi:unnamed protein product [Nezara viridula]|uniref:Uncharacterized protein n=1 Tax=Nezara viridula TaxID=85310 RepID=A0A9P0H4L6_NEZVI|nr:unnamed protein product [Nezara viridula]